MPFDIRTKKTGAGIKSWLQEHEIEPQALQQLRNMAVLPVVFKHLAVMPDAHLGKGACVGSVIATKNAISPAAVGVDIGCGMAAAKANITADQLPDNLRQIRKDVENVIPVGPPPSGQRSKSDNRKPMPGVVKLFERYKVLPPKVQTFRHIAEKQVGTLGSGNHFV